MSLGSRERKSILSAVVLLILLAAPVSARAEELAADSAPAAYHDTSLALSSMTSSGTKGEASPVKQTPALPAGSSETLAKDTSGGNPTPALMPSPSQNFNGIAEGVCECIPPDPSGAAGPTQFMEVVNTELAVYSKTGEGKLAPEPTNTLWKEFGPGNPCEKTNSGDATVLFDTMAQRWVIQQFSLGATYADCVAVSKTSDATKEWYRYEFRYEHFPDYPKMGVWPDGYYVSFNLFNGSFIGAEKCALNRSPMLEGKEASQQCFVGASTAGSSLLPATVNGSTTPPSGQAEWFVGLSPTEANALAFWKFHVDWSNPANTTFTGPTNLSVEGFSEACGGFGNCVPQSETATQLEGLGDRLLFPLTYRNFGGHQSMVVDHSVATTGGVGMRWYELRPTESGGLSVYQQGTYAPDSTYRWMGSIIMDKVGDMALGYSASSSSLHPQIRYTGRLSTDTLGSMPQGEQTLYSGLGSQTGYSRWGDYTQMSVDPSEECSFWYVNQYQPSNGAFNWHTRIGSFKFPSCNQPPKVTTESATYTNTFEPQLNGTVNPEGSDTHYQFEYGETTSYGTKIPIPAADVGSGKESVSVSQTLKGLKHSTTYHFRITAENEAGSAPPGEDKSFTTLPACKNSTESCTWTTQTTPNPVAKTEAKLEGVSCASSTMCMAVGSDIYKGTGIVDLWNGTEWTLNKTTSSELKAISCPSATYCMTIAKSNGAWRLQVEEFLKIWVISSQTPPVPTGGTIISLNSISCSSETACTAVGSYLAEGGGYKPLVDRWNGKEWSIQTAPNPTEGSAQRAMLGVSCPSSTSCTTVGEASSKPTAEHWNGTEWSVITPPNPTGAVGATLESVSCTSSTSCMAVGNFHESGKKKKTLTESWSGTEWKVKSSPNPAEAVGEVKFASVSCLSSTSCFAAGSYVTKEVIGIPEEEKTLAETWNGTEWTIQSSSNAAGAKLNSLAGVSCTSSIACTAIGSDAPELGASERLTLGERYE
jgi:hypothetical protein